MKVWHRLGEWPSLSTMVQWVRVPHGVPIAIISRVVSVQTLVYHRLRLPPCRILAIGCGSQRTPDLTSGPEGIPRPVPCNFYDPFEFSFSLWSHGQSVRSHVRVSTDVVLLGYATFPIEQEVEEKSKYKSLVNRFWRTAAEGVGDHWCIWPLDTT